MAENDHMYVVYPLDGDQNSPMVGVTPYSDTSVLGMLVQTMLYIGDPFYVFATIPFDFSNGISVNWTGAPQNGSIGDNRAAIDGMLATPPITKIAPPGQTPAG